MKLLKRILISLLILIVGLYLFASWSLSGRVLFPESSMEKTKKVIRDEWNTTLEDVLATMPPANDFSVTSFDGLQLNGKYFVVSDSTECAIIFPHGWGALWADMLKYTKATEDCECNLVFYDHRVHGASEGKYATAGIKESKDLWTVTDWTKEQFNLADNQIGWIGSSWGAATSIIAGAEPRDVGFILADAPYQDWYSAIFERGIKDYGSGVKLLSAGVMQVVNMRAGVDSKEASPRDKVSNVTEPLLLIHSEGDQATNSQQSINISKNMSPRNSEFHHTQWGNDHVQDVVNNGEEFKEITVNFLNQYAPHFLASPDSIN